MNSNLQTEFGERLVTFLDGEQGITRPVIVKRERTQEIDGRKVHYFRASDATVDGDGEIVEPSGWDLKDYQRNPVVLDAHNRKSITSIIGTGVESSINDGALIIGVKFARSNPLGRIAEGLVEEGALNAGSVGFKPKAWEPGRQAGVTRRFTAQTLKEFSLVPVPTNANALALAVKSGAVSKWDVQELLELLTEFCSDQAGAETDSRAKGTAADVAQLVQLAQTINQQI